MHQGFRTVEQSPVQALDGVPNLDQYKKDFAYHYLRLEKQSFKAALKVFPTNRGMAMQAANYWPSDPGVIRQMEELVEQLGEEAFLPNKNDFLREMWGVIKNPRVEAKDKVKAAELYAKARGFFPEKTTNAENVTSVVNNVMVVPNMGSNQDWEIRAATQQRALQAKINADADAD